MRKLFILLMLVMSIGTTFAQQKKVTIGNYSLYDSSGTLVLSKTSGESKFKVNGSGWVRPRDLDSTVAGSGLSLNTVLGLRFNAGSGVEVDANDTVITTGVTSYAVVDSISIGGTSSLRGEVDSLFYSNILKIGQLWIVKDEGDAILNFQVDTLGEPFVGSISVNEVPAVVFYGTGVREVNFLNYTRFFDSLRVSGRLIASGNVDFENSDTVKIGTTGDYDFRLKRKNEVYLTLSSANLIVEGNTPLKFMNSNVFVSGFSQTGTLGNAPTIGDPTKYLIVYDNNGVDFAIPMWDIP